MKFNFLKIKITRLKILELTARLSFFSVFVVFFGSIFVLLVFVYFSATLPSPDKLTNRRVDQSTKIFDRNGELLYDIYEEKDRTVVSLGDVSPYVISATLAIEDAEFYKHSGFDVIGIIRAAFNTATGQGLQGGSTLTQQLTKNALLTQDRNIVRKIKEFILSVQIENKYDKDKILEGYLNETPYGGTAYGVEAASQLYFKKSSKDLSLGESAFIAGLAQRPSVYSPFGSNPALGIERQKYVLKIMLDKGWVDKNGVRRKISQKEYEDSIKSDLVFAKIQTLIRAPHFVFWVLQKLYDRFGEEYVKSGGLRVTTTLDINKHEEIQNIVVEELNKVTDLNVGNSSVVALDPQTREVLVMVGSYNYFDEKIGSFNVATSPTRQPGSSIKPLVYATGLKQGYTASTVFLDVPTSFSGADGGKDYTPKNYDGKFRGPIQLRYALANSINITAVKMLKIVGLNSFLQTATDFGITSFDREPESYGLSLALGGGEASLLQMTNAFGVFASGGFYEDPKFILKIEDKNGKLINYDSRSKKQVLDKGIAYIISDILSDNSARLLAFGPGNALEFKTDKVAVKTGTTDDIRDNWTIGYTKKIVVGVWAGNNDNTQMNKNLASGVTGAAPIWNRSIKLFLENELPNKFDKPDNVISKEVGTITGGNPADGVEGRRIEYFIKGTEPVVRSKMVLELQVCTKDNRIANEECIKDGKAEKREYIKLKALLPEWQESVDKWLEENYKDKDGMGKFFPPTKKSNYKGG